MQMKKAILLLQLSIFVVGGTNFATATSLTSPPVITLGHMANVIEDYGNRSDSKYPGSWEEFNRTSEALYPEVIDVAP
jgi:hypothetical protein